MVFLRIGLLTLTGMIRIIAGRKDGDITSSIQEANLQKIVMANEIKSVADKVLPYHTFCDFTVNGKSEDNNQPSCGLVFPGVNELHKHGRIGVIPETGEELWKPRQTPPRLSSLPAQEKKQKVSKGGFYQELSDALPVDRAVLDLREAPCIAAANEISMTDLPEVSVVIIFHNELLSMLLRTLHSILNNTDSRLLREIVLVDDGSTYNESEQQYLRNYLRYLPKVRLLRLKSRVGIVNARLAGINATESDIFVMLDSHVEINPGWLEPMLVRVINHPEIVVSPQITTIDSETFEFTASRGIGCNFSMRWAMVEQGSRLSPLNDPTPVESPSMAGGIFVMNKQFFYDVGAYDEGFRGWGSENVEMSLRIWTCGGRIECSPCSAVYHMFRHGGIGYSNNAEDLWRNKMRTAAVWLDEYFPISQKIINIGGAKAADYGDISERTTWRQSKQCKSFSWYLQHIEPTHDLRKLEYLVALGRISTQSDFKKCLAVVGPRVIGSAVGVMDCPTRDNLSPEFGFYMSMDDTRIRLMSNDKRCVIYINGALELGSCIGASAELWNIERTGNGEHMVSHDLGLCLDTTSRTGITKCERAQQIYTDKLNQ